jgi:hypothetical protein
MAVRPPVPDQKRTLVATMSALVALAFIGAALPVQASIDTELNIVNLPPIVEEVNLASLEILPSAGSTTSVSPTIVVTDANGCSDIVSVKVTILKPDESEHIAEADATYQSCSLGTIATYTYSFDMAYHDAPALGGNTYKIKVVATDSKGATGSNLLSLLGFNYLELVAVNIPAGALDFGGPINPGNSTSIEALSVTNHGNVALDMQVSGTDMEHDTEAVSIPASATKYSPNSDMESSSSLSTSTSLLGLGLSAGASSSSTLYWRLDVPSGDEQWVPSGDYTGTLTLSAVKSS